MTGERPRWDATAWLLSLVVAGLLSWFVAGLTRSALQPSLAGALLLALAACALAARAPLVASGPFSGDRGYRIGLFLAATVAVLVALPTTGAYFLGDDFGYVQLFHNKAWGAVLRPGDISDGIWGHPLDEVRPVFALAFKLGTALHGTNGLSWHLGNAALHGLAVALVCLLARGAGAPPLVAGLAGLLFAVAPAHTETVAWVTGRVDSLPTLLYVGTVLLFWRYRQSGATVWYGAALLTFAAGLLSKEILLTLPLVLVVSDWMGVRGGAPSERPSLRALLRTHAPFVVVTLLFLFLRFATVGTFAREGRLGGALVSRLADQERRLRYLLVPFEAIARPAALDWNASFPALLIVLTVAGLLFVLVAAGAGGRRARALLLFFGVVWPGLTLLPLFATYVSPRHLYLPGVGVAVALAIALLPPEATGVRRGRTRLVLAVLLLGVYGMTQFGYARRWAGTGEVSRAVHLDLPRRMSSIPPEAVVVLTGIPAFAGDARTPLWIFALPFALQPPYLPEDLYRHQQVLESPDVYCCPAAVWWARKQPIFASLLAGPDDEGVPLTLLHWNRRRRTFAVHRAIPRRAAVRTALERVVGAPFESGGPVTSDLANRLLAALDAEIRYTEGSPGEDEK